MKKLILPLYTLGLWLLPSFYLVALAQSPAQKAAAEASLFVAKLNKVFLFPLIQLLLGVAFLVFVYGCAVYVINSANESAREEGRKHIMYGLIGLVIMLSAFAILSIAAGTFGLKKDLECATNPNATGCDFYLSPSGGGGIGPGGGGGVGPGGGGGVDPGGGGG